MAARKGPELKETDDDFGCVDVVNKGATVFKKRYWSLMFFYFGYTLYGLLSAPSIPFLLVRAWARESGSTSVDGRGRRDRPAGRPLNAR